MNSTRRRAVCRASLYKPGTSWVFRSKRLTATRVVGPTDVRVAWQDGPVPSLA